LFLPLNLNPRRITDNKVKAAIISKHISKFKLPVHKLVVVRYITHKRKAGKHFAELVEVNVLNHHVVFDIDIEKTCLLLLRICRHRALEYQVHVRYKFGTFRQKIRLTDGPEPEGAPIVHGEFQPCVCACVLSVFGLIDITQELVFFSDRLSTVKTGVLVTVYFTHGDSSGFKVASCLDLLSPKHVYQL